MLSLPSRKGVSTAMRLLLLEKAYSDLDVILLDGNTTQMDIILLKQKRWHIHPAMWYSVSN